MEDLAKLERGEKEPTWRTVQAICHALRVSEYQEPEMWRMNDRWNRFRFRNQVGCVLWLCVLPLFALLVPLSYQLLGETGPYIVAVCCFVMGLFGIFYWCTAPCPRCSKPFYTGKFFHSAFAWKCMNCGIPKYSAFVPEEQPDFKGDG